MAELLGTSARADSQAQQSLRSNTVAGKYVLGAALALNDTINMVKLPAGCMITSILVNVPDLDTGAGAIVIDVQLKTLTTKYVTGATAGQAGGNICWPNPIATTGGTAGVGANVISAADTLQMLIATGPSTGATTGTIRWVVKYTTDVQFM